jgi:hypothetical protein
VALDINNGTTLTNAGGALVQGRNNTNQVFQMLPLGAGGTLGLKLTGDASTANVVLSTSLGSTLTNGSANVGVNSSVSGLNFTVGATDVFYVLASKFQPSADLTSVIGDSTHRVTGIFSRHYSSGGTAPTVAIGNATQLGTGPSASTAGTDTVVLVTITTGTGPAVFVGGTAITAATVSFNTAYGTAPKVNCAAVNNNAAAAQSGATGIFFYADSASTTTGQFVIKAIDSGAGTLTASTAYIFACDTIE